MTDWNDTGVWHTESCGCVYLQQVQSGPYHERWRRLLTCPKHGPLGEATSAEPTSTITSPDGVL